MVRRIRRTWANLRKNIYEGESRENNVRVMRNSSVIFALIMQFFVLYNHLTGYYLAEILCNVLSFSCFIFGVFIYGKNKYRIASCWFFVLLTSGVLTVFSVLGTNDGFAILWSLLVPMGIMYCMGVLYGLIESVFLELLFIILFYTPIRELYMVGKYTETFMNRYPILYATFLLIIGIIMINYHQMALKQLEYEKRLMNDLDFQTKQSDERGKRIERLSFEMVESLVNAIEAKDTYTNGHSKRVAEYSVRIARRMGLPKKAIEDIHVAAILHDIGKIGIPDTVINKTGKLTEEEYELIKRHPSIGAQILANINEIPIAVVGAKYHHERYDGKGYPQGLKGEEIPFEARLISVADAYDAMTSNRSYRSYMPQAKVRGEIENNLGTQFDPKIAKYMLEMIDEDVDYAMHG